MVESQERKSLYKMIESIEFLVVVQIQLGAPIHFCFVVGVRIVFAQGVAKRGLCNVAHAKRTLHNKDPIRTSGTMVSQFT